MGQFSVHKNKDSRMKSTYPYLLDVQTDLLRDLSTRVVVPLIKQVAKGKKEINHLTPVIEVDGQKFLMMTPQLAGISLAELGPIAGTATQQRTEIVAALDFLITGI